MVELVNAESHSAIVVADQDFYNLAADQDQLLMAERSYHSVPVASKRKQQFQKISIPIIFNGLLKNQMK